MLYCSPDPTTNYKATNHNFQQNFVNNQVGFDTLKNANKNMIGKLLVGSDNQDNVSTGRF